MNRQTNVPLFATIIGVSIVMLIVFVLILPQFTTMKSLRNDVDSSRLLLESLKSERQNVNSIRQDVADIETVQSYLDGLPLQEASSVPFFIKLDTLFDANEIDNPTTRLDTPSTSTQEQPLGIHFAFAATFEQTLKFLRSLSTLDQPITVDVITFRNDEKTKLSTVTIDGIVPWRPRNP